MVNFYSQLTYDHLLDMEKVQAVFKSLHQREAAWSEKEWAEQVTAFREYIISNGDTSLKWRLYKAGSVQKTHVRCDARIDERS